MQNVHSVSHKLNSFFSNKSLHSGKENQFFERSRQADQFVVELLFKECQRPLLPRSKKKYVWFNFKKLNNVNYIPIWFLVWVCQRLGLHQRNQFTVVLWGVYLLIAWFNLHYVVLKNPFDSLVLCRQAMKMMDLALGDRTYGTERRQMGKARNGYTLSEQPEEEEKGFFWSMDCLINRGENNSTTPEVSYHVTS